MANDNPSIPGKAGVRRFLYRLGRLLRWGLLRATISGRENIPASGPTVIIINHIAFFDPVVVWMFIPRIVIPMAKIEAFSFPFVGWVMRMGGAIPVQRGEADTRAIKVALQVLKQDECVLLAPEGTRSPNGQLQPAKDGAMMLALRSGAAVLPVAITGTQHLIAHWRKLRRAPVTISIGEPFKLELESGRRRPSREEMASLTEKAMVRLAGLLPPEYRGVYG